MRCLFKHVLSEQRLVFGWRNEGVVVKHSDLDISIRKNHFTIPMLNSFDPLALVNTIVCPEHFTKSVALVFFVITLVDIPTGPLENSIPVLICP